MRDPVTSIVARPLLAAPYAPYGGVIEAARGDAANQGTARRSNRLVELANDRPGAALNVCVFRCAPRSLPLTIALLE